MLKEVKVTVPSRVITSVDMVVCDFCHTQIKDESYSKDEVVLMKSSLSWFDLKSTYSVDMCLKCFDEKFIPWCESQGVKPRTLNVDF